MPSRVFRFWEANQIIPAIIGFIPVYVMDIPAAYSSRVSDIRSLSSFIILKINTIENRFVITPTG